MKNKTFEKRFGLKKAKELRKNLSLKATGRIVTEKAKKNCKKTWEKKKKQGWVPWNKDLTKETNKSVAKISKTLTGKMVGEKNPFFGKHHTEETKEKSRRKKIGIPSSLKGKTVEEIMGDKRGKQRRKKLRDKRKGKTWEQLFKPSTIEKLRNNFAGPFKKYEETIVLKRGTAKKSKIEKRFCEELKKRGIKNFETDKVVCGFVPDILFEKQKFIVEINGMYYHNLPNMKKRDIRKRKAYSLNGYKLLEITDAEINNNIEACIEEIKEVITCRDLIRQDQMEKDR